jgi:hypothetical protein
LDVRENEKQVGDCRLDPRRLLSSVSLSDIWMVLVFSAAEEEEEEEEEVLYILHIFGSDLLDIENVKIKKQRPCKVKKKSELSSFSLLALCFVCLFYGCGGRDLLEIVTSQLMSSVSRALLTTPFSPHILRATWTASSGVK